jgi:hypothetical protein
MERISGQEGILTSAAPQGPPQGALNGGELRQMPFFSARIAVFHKRKTIFYIF